MAPPRSTDLDFDSSIDPRWPAVDDYTTSHLHPASRPNASILTTALSRAADAGLDPINASPAQAKFLAIQARAIGAARALELGTLGGYTSIFLLTQNPALHVTTVEVDAHAAAVARRNFAEAGVADRVELREGAGVDVLRELEAEVRDGTRKRFDMAFVDADKVNNATYFDSAVRMSRSGALVFVDNVVRVGKVASEEMGRTDERVAGSRRVIEQAGRDERVDAMVMQMVGDKGYDGMLVAIVK